jgi:hypothetical protein
VCSVSQEYPTRVVSRCLDETTCRVVAADDRTMTVRGEASGSTKIEVTATFGDEEVTDTRTVDVVAPARIELFCGRGLAPCPADGLLGDALTLALGEPFELYAASRGLRPSGEEVDLTSRLPVDADAPGALGLSRLPPYSFVLTPQAAGEWELELSAADLDRTLVVTVE